MSQIKKKFIANNAIDETKIELSNDAFMVGLANGGGDQNIIKVRTDDALEVGSRLYDSTAGAPTADAMFANKKYVDDQLVALGSVMVFKGGVDASGALSQLDDTEVGHYYRVTTAGTLGGVELAVGDAIVAHTAVVGTPADLSAFLKIDNTDLDNQTAAEVPFSPAGTIAATDVQAAIEELDSEFNARADARIAAASVTDLSDVSDAGSGIIISAAERTAIGTNTTNISNAQSEIDAIEAALGAVISSAGAYVAHSGSNYIDSNSDVTEDLLDLDAQAKVNADAIAVNAGDILTNAGAISSNDTDISNLQGALGSVDEASINYANNNYIVDGEDLVTSAGKLDAQVKANADAIAGASAPQEEIIALVAGDITNQYVDLAAAASSADSIQISVVGGPIQEKGVDYTVSLAGGAGGVTRISFSGDLASGGDAALIATDKLIVKYSA
jgi:hypothetical protein